MGSIIRRGSRRRLHSQPLRIPMLWLGSIAFVLAALVVTIAHDVQQAAILERIDGEITVITEEIRDLRQDYRALANQLTEAHEQFNDRKTVITMVEPEETRALMWHAARNMRDARREVPLQQLWQIHRRLLALDDELALLLDQRHGMEKPLVFFR